MRPAFSLSMLGLTVTCLGLVACSQPDPRHNLSTASPPTPSSSRPAAGSATVTAAPSPTVPVDQIPPGRPASWVPAGVPTTAPYQEPGDVVPKFTLPMFTNTPEGALAAALYYIDARNWAFATLDPTPFLILCESKSCKRSAEIFRGYARAKQHVVGARETSGAPNLIAVSAKGGVQWIVRAKLKIAAGKVVDDHGRTKESQAESIQINDLIMRWDAKMWRVQDDALGQ